MKKIISLFFSATFLIFALPISASAQKVLILQPGPDVAWDTYICSVLPNHVGYADGMLVTAWTLDGTPYVGMNVFKFDLSQIPMNATIIDARLSLFWDPNGSWSGHSGANASFIKRVTSPWDRNTVCWNNKPSYTDEGKIDFPETTNPHQDFPDIDITHFVQGWVADPTTNFGMINGLYTTVPYACLVLSSSIEVDPAKWPKLVVSYSDCPPPEARFSVTVTGLVASFTNQSVNADNLLWDFGDGSSSTGQNPIHSYAVQGKYKVCLAAHDSCGNSISCDTVSVTCNPPEARFAVTVNGLEASFTNQSVHADTLSWDFGDGSSSTEQNPIHSYVIQGKYKVCLVAHDSCGNGISCDTVNVTCNQPEATWYYIPEGQTIAFFDTTAGSISWLWNFGDEQFDTVQNPVHQYRHEATYNVCLTVHTLCGVDNRCDTVPVFSPLTAHFSLQSEGQLVFFADHTENALSWIWNFGDGTSSVEKNPAHRYQNPGHYKVCLKVTTDSDIKFGCEDLQIERLSVNTTNIISLYPNPAGDWLTLHRESPNVGEADITITNLGGVEVYNEKIVFQPGAAEIKTNINFLHEGYFFLRISSGEYSKLWKFIKQ